MKVNPLLNDIFRGSWLLEPQWVVGAAPLVENFLKGLPAFPLQQEPKSILTIYDASGNKVKPNDEGRLIVPENSVAVVEMIGAVIKYGDFCTYGADEIVAALEKAQSNPNVQAIILKIDGPGGAVSAIDDFRGFEKKKPIIGLASACMSLHYWTALSLCDHLMADGDVSPRFGSVGVVSSFVDTKKHWEEKGYVFHEIYPDESKDKNLAFQEALKGNYDLIKSEHLSPIAQKFQASVRAALPNLREEKGVLTGATFDADKALGLNMIHSIGNFKKAFAMALMYSELKTTIDY